MRYSPYDMMDYGLQHRGGSVSPVSMLRYDEATWNLYWASMPQLDAFLDLAYEDFEGFKALGQAFPFAAKVQADSVLLALHGLKPVLRNEEPKIAWTALQAYGPDLRTILGPAAVGWLTTVGTRLTMAQSLVDVKEAAALCRAVVAVDFKAGRRL